MKSSDHRRRLDPHQSLPSPFHGTLQRKPRESSPLRLERIRKLTNPPPFHRLDSWTFPGITKTAPGQLHLPSSPSREKNREDHRLRHGREPQPRHSAEVWVRFGHPCEGNFEKIFFLILPFLCLSPFTHLHPDFFSWSPYFRYIRWLPKNPPRRCAAISSLQVGQPGGLPDPRSSRLPS